MNRKECQVLTDMEKRLLDMTGDLANAFCDLPKMHPNDVEEFVSALHRIQDLIYSRSGRREYPG